jgi:hypothetical protein
MRIYDWLNADPLTVSLDTGSDGTNIFDGLDWQNVRRVFADRGEVFVYVVVQGIIMSWTNMEITINNITLEHFCFECGKSALLGNPASGHTWGDIHQIVLQEILR